MKIYLIAVGKVKSKIYLEQINKYVKQIPYPFEIIEIKDEPKKSGMAKEKTNILKRIPKNSYLISLDRLGKEKDSLKFSKDLEKITVRGFKNIVFIIGGSYGLDQELLKMSDEVLSFSKFTFPHQLMRLILVEQVFRAFKIMQKHPYHK